MPYQADMCQSHYRLRARNVSAFSVGGLLVVRSGRRLLDVSFGWMILLFVSVWIIVE